MLRGQEGPAAAGGWISGREDQILQLKNRLNPPLVPFPASVLQKKKSSPRAYQEARRLVREFQEMFQIPPATVGEEAAEPSAEEQVIKALLAAATSKQGSPKQLRLPAKSVTKKVPKV